MAEQRYSPNSGCGWRKCVRCATGERRRSVRVFGGANECARSGKAGVQGMAGGQSLTQHRRRQRSYHCGPDRKSGQECLQFCDRTGPLSRVDEQGAERPRIFPAVCRQQHRHRFPARHHLPALRSVFAGYPVPAADYFQNVLPELGLSAGEYVTVPCFGEARQDATQSGAPNTLPNLQTPDTPNVKDLAATGGPLHDTFFGCWLDINQMTPALPAMPPSGNEDGPWPGITLEPVRQAFIVNEHTCIVAEIAFDPVPINAGAHRSIPTSWLSATSPGATWRIRASKLRAGPSNLSKCGPRRRNWRRVNRPTS